jgi:hypothetical protein
MEFLLASNEVATMIALEERLRPWCSDGIGLRWAHVGRAWLRLGRPARAADAFVRAADYIAFEPGVLAAVGCAATTPERTLGMYFIKVGVFLRFSGIPSRPLRDRSVRPGGLVGRAPDWQTGVSRFQFRLDGTFFLLLHLSISCWFYDNILFPK